MSNRKEKLSLVFVGLLLFGLLLVITKVSVAAPLPFDAPGPHSWHHMGPSSLARPGSLDPCQTNFQPSGPI